jgi:hypothetical protein
MHIKKHILINENSRLSGLQSRDEPFPMSLTKPD